MDPIEPWVDRDELRRLADALLAGPRAAAEVSADATYGDDFVGYAAGGGTATPAPLPSAPQAEAPTPASTPAAVPQHPHHAPVPAPVPNQEPPTAPGQAAPTPPSQPAAEESARRALATAREIAQRGGLLIDPHVEVAHSPRSQPAAPSAPAPAALDAAPAQLTQISPVPSPTESHRAPVATPFLARLKAYGTWLQEGIRAKSFFVLDRDGRVLIDEVQSPKLQQVACTLAQASRTANRQAGAAAIGNIHMKIAPETVLEVVPVMTRYGPLILGIIVDQPLSSRNVETVARGLQQVIDGSSGAGTS